MVMSLFVAHSGCKHKSSSVSLTTTVVFKMLWPISGLNYSYRNKKNFNIDRTHSPTPRCTVLLEKLTGLQLVKIFHPHFTEPEGSLPHKRPPTVSILGQPNPVHIPTSHLLQIRPNIIHPSTPRSPHWSLSHVRKFSLFEVEPTNLSDYTSLGFYVSRHLNTPVQLFPKFVSVPLFYSKNIHRSSHVAHTTVECPGDRQPKI